MSDDMDVLEFIGDPNCPKCLRRMQVVVGGFFCDGCQIAKRVSDNE